MAANVTLPGTGETVRTIDRAGVETQIMALDLNPAGAESLMAGTMPTTVSRTGTVVDTNNSTTTPLNDGQTFTGTATDCLGYAALTVFIAADQYNEVNVDFSTNGTDWDWAEFSTYSDAGASGVGRHAILARYARVRVSNASGVNDTFLRVQTLLHTHAATVDPEGGRALYVGESRPLPSGRGLAVTGPQQPGTSASGLWPLLVAGKDGGDALRAIKTDASGELQVDVLALPAMWTS
jgi:hypothetical protein